MTVETLIFAVEPQQTFWLMLEGIARTVTQVAISLANRVMHLGSQARRWN
jgi:hypothetical protein